MSCMWYIIMMMCMCLVCTYSQAIRAAWQQTSLGAMDLGALASTITPEMMSEAQADPQVRRTLGDNRHQGDKRGQVMSWYVMSWLGPCEIAIIQDACSCPVWCWRGKMPMCKQIYILAHVQGTG